MYNQVVNLIAISDKADEQGELIKDEYGDPVKEEISREVFAKVKSIGMKETYQALAVGMKPELTFVLPDYYEYEDEKILDYEGKRYTVLRIYKTESKELELVVYKDGNSE